METQRDLRKIIQAVGVSALPAGKTVSPLATGIFRPAKRFRRWRQGSSAGKTVSLLATAIFPPAKRFRRRRPSFALADSSRAVGKMLNFKGFRRDRLV